MFFSRRTTNFCWICGSSSNLTGEHKIKKTDLKRNPDTVQKHANNNSGKEYVIQSLNSNT